MSFPLCPDTAAAGIRAINAFPLKASHGLEFLQTEQHALAQAEEVFHHGIVQVIVLPARALPDLAGLANLSGRMGALSFPPL